ncbi:XRE family transcriptional regulator [Streptomyces cinnabarinus]|uniref:XRE family transcriptional regulator n=1 Tax=Streptomyces cinnabarinus TaxID=67287 RepID=A0ABY7KKR8_9ACTN|nr:XRE family transcriptional regulator [Streptomyces cinnabarinus]WAZ23291.1 XRE family transcriptional regulator [Streptomyces cinnabarinus]
MTPARLAAELRELRARTGLSLKALADRTTYSKSSWERYLNGRTLPPRQAVQDLCRIAREPEGRLLALWEIAESEWSGRARETPRPEQEPDQRRPRRRAPLLAVSAVLLAGVVTAALALLLPGRSSTPSPSPTGPTGPRCRAAACEGQDPMHMGCGKGPANLAEHRTASGAWVALRYNEACGTSWARMWGTRVGDRLEVSAGGGPTRSTRIGDAIDAESYVYTPMTATRPGATVRACFRPVKGRRECVDARATGQSSMPNSSASSRSTSSSATSRSRTVPSASVSVRTWP